MENEKILNFPAFILPNHMIVTAKPDSEIIQKVHENINFEDFFGELDTNSNSLVKSSQKTRD